ncbi:MAG: hypothetical protein CMH61_01780 [Nanoarchaeota archaeon]|nr:hypothetical protein [Nanoarchaeota archaeon]|tara:strand:+ start:1063 stop:1350 length:288 start_codon:yes stop_codon:yes gene_type:complete
MITPDLPEDSTRANFEMLEARVKSESPDFEVMTQYGDQPEFAVYTGSGVLSLVEDSGIFKLQYVPETKRPVGLEEHQYPTMGEACNKVLELLGYE